MERIEATCGMALAAVLALAVTGTLGVLALSLFVSQPRPPLPWALAAAAVACGAIAIEFLSVGFIRGTLYGAPSPALVYTAMAQPRYPALLRPLVALWWCLHFTALAVGGHWVLSQVEAAPAVWRDEIARLWVLRFVLYAGLGFGSNAYLLLMAGALCRRQRILMAVHRVRLLVDVAVAVLVGFLPPALG